MTFSVTVETHSLQGGKDDNETVYQEGRRHINEQAILAQDVDEGQIVSLSNLVVIMVMGRGDFDSAWIENGAEGHERWKGEKTTAAIMRKSDLTDL